MRPLKLAALAAAAFTAIGGTMVVLASPASASENLLSVNQQINNYIGAHPDDYIGIDKFAQKLGSNPLKFQIEGLTEPVSAVRAQQLTAKANSVPLAATNSLAPSIPDNAFTVSGFWSKVSDSDGTGLSYFGKWDFKALYGQGGNPADAFGLAVKDITSSCWTHEGDGVDAWTDLGYKSNRVSRRTVDFDSAVYSVNDSQGADFVDHGSAWIAFKARRNCPGYAYGKTYYEANIQGNGSWTVSITIAAFSLSYTGTDHPTSLQKSTGLYKIARDV